MRLLPTLFAALSIAAPLAAGGAESLLTAAALADPATAAYLGVTADRASELAEARIIATADLDGDGISDVVVALRAGRSVAISALLLPGTAGGAPTVAGSIRIDSNELPIARTMDVTGDGTSEIHLTFIRPGAGRNANRSVAIAGVADGQLVEMFRSVLDEVERDAINHRRSSHQLRLTEARDGQPAGITVESRMVELVDTPQGEREIASTISTGTATYRLKDGRFALEKSEMHVPTAEQMLSAAAELLDAGATERALLLAQHLAEPGTTVGNITIHARASALVKQIGEGGAKATAEIAAPRGTGTAEG